MRLAIKLFLALALATTVLSAGIKSKGSSNSLGVLTYQENPFSYTVAHVKEVKIIEHGRSYYTYVSYTPHGTYSDFLSEITFCGNEWSRFDGKQHFLAFTYRTEQSRGYCYDLISVDEIKPKLEPWK